MHRLSVIIMALFALSAVSCTGSFMNINTDKTGISETQLDMDYYRSAYKFNIIQQAIYFNYDYGGGKNWPFQIIQNLNADMFSGFMHDYLTFSDKNNSDYNLQDNWNRTMWQMTYSYIFSQIYHLENESRKGDMPAFFGAAKVLKVMVMHRVSDFYGPVIYSRFADPGKQYLPDSQESAYDRFFIELDSAAVSFARLIDDEPTPKVFSQTDLLLDGEAVTWIKLANSLRMRLAIRIAMADPIRAEAEFLKAYNDVYGYFENVDEMAAVKTAGAYSNPLGEISKVWGEALMNASVESFLKGYSDPRMGAFFEKSKDVPMNGGGVIEISGEYHGIRQGTRFSHTLYSNMSKVNITPSDPPVLLHSAEVWFLRAEAALRGWTSESVKMCYEEGVASSFARWRVQGVEEYLNDGESAPADYVDVLAEVYPGSDGSCPAASSVTVKWDDASSNEEKLERIITQKWLSLFPEGCEAWAEQRRTGYPKLIPPKHTADNTIGIDQGDAGKPYLIRRIPFPGEISVTNSAQYQALLTALGGPDSGATRLWWDTGANF